jgi:putative ABC transport system substrate-binding protein
MQQFGRDRVESGHRADIVDRSKMALRRCHSIARNVTIAAKGEETMRRREFVTLLGSAVAAWPLTAFGKAQRIAFVITAFPAAQFSGKQLRELREPFSLAFFNELDRLGYVEGQSLLIEGYSGLGRASHFPDLARDVVSRNPDVIITISTDLTLDFKAATTTIPILGVFAIPVEAGIVANLARPGGNITGVAMDVGPEQWGKRFQLLQQAVPQATKFGVLQSRATREKYGSKEEEVLQLMGVTLVGPPFDHPVDEAEYRRVFAALAQDHAEGIVVVDEPENVVNQKLIIELAEKNRLPAIYPYKMFVQAGGLMSYGIDVGDQGRRLADVVSEILKGARPGEIPISQPTKFELIINLKTAKALGLTVPATMLVAADEVIE